MGSDYDEYVEKTQHGDGYVSIHDLEGMSLDAESLAIVLRNAQRPSDWPENRLPAHTSTRTGLAESTRGFLETNRDYMFPEVSDKNADVKY